MTEFYNCLIFLQFFTASFTIVLTPQGYARERIFSMKEQLYTIPLNDAVNAQDECPFCFIHRSIEQDLLDFVLGSGSSYMEADIREQTDKAGFCRYHFQKMFDYGNTLGNAWILKTHYQRMIREMQQEFASFRPGKSSLLGKFKKAEGNENTIGMWVRAKEDSCYICSQYKDTYARYLDTFFYLWKNDESFRNKVINGKGFCPTSAISAKPLTASFPIRKNRTFTISCCRSWNPTCSAFPKTSPGWWKNSTIATKTPTGRAPGMPSSAVCRN